MNPEKLLALYTQITRDNQEAFEFLKIWGTYVHGIDDLIDGDRPIPPEDVVKRFFDAAILYNCSFWKKYGDFLGSQVVSITNDYIDSNNIALHSAQRDFLRSTGNTMLILTAFICGGYDHMRLLSPLIRNLSYKEHHDNEGKPI